MNHGTPDLFGHVPRPKSIKKRNAVASDPRAEDHYFVVYAPERQRLYAVLICIFAFVLWYVFGAQLTDIAPFNVKELPSPIYGALVFLGLVVTGLWFCKDFFATCSAYIRPDTDRRIYGRYLSKRKALWLRSFISLGCVFLVLVTSFLVLHGFWNARSVAVIVTARLLQPPQLTEDRIENIVSLQASETKHEPYGPSAPIERKLRSPVVTGSISVAPTKKRQKKAPAVKEVDPLSKSIKEIGDWFGQLFGGSLK